MKEGCIFKKFKEIFQRKLLHKLLNISLHFAAVNIIELYKQV